MLPNHSLKACQKDGSRSMEERRMDENMSFIRKNEKYNQNNLKSTLGRRGSGLR